jgi:hypothetical protein
MRLFTPAGCIVAVTRNEMDDLKPIKATAITCSN